MEKKNSVVLKRAHGLVNTSVQDMQSGLWAYKTIEDKRVIGVALIICRNRGEKTKAKILQAKFNKMQKELAVS